MDYNERMIVKTIESPCRKCSRRFDDRESCMLNCPELEAFQKALVRTYEEKVVWFSTRLRAA